MLNLSQSVRLSGGSVTLRAWGAHVADAYLLDLLTVTATLGAMREEWAAFRRQDIEQAVWGPYWRLVHASLDDCTLPASVTWGDRLLLLDAMWQLNDQEENEKRLLGLTQRASAATLRRQAQRVTSC